MAAVDGQQRSVDSGARPEERPVQAWAELEAPPGRPGGGPERLRRRRCVLVGNCGLENEVGSGRAPVGFVEQAGQQLGRETERGAGHNPVGLPRQAEPPEVALDDVDLGRQTVPIDAVPQPAGPGRVHLDRQHLRAAAGQGQGERAVPGSEVDDELAGTNVEAGDQPADGGAISEEVLAERPAPSIPLGTSLSPGHG